MSQQTDDLALQLIAKEQERDQLVEQINKENQERLQPIVNEIGNLQGQILEAAKSSVNAE
tara:strand:- start:70 stop:249 length:180 start_codon:yes stop_codon:yes gene_type:complete